MIFYELWDLTSKNLLGTYQTQAHATTIVSEALAAHGRPYVENLALGWGDNEDPSRGAEIASGSALIDRAQSRVA